MMNQKHGGREWTQMVDLQKIKQEMRDHVREKMDYGRDYGDEEVGELIDEELLENPETCRLTVDQRLRLKKELFDSMRRLDVLQFFVDDPGITEIMINGMEHIFVERSGKLTQLELAFDSKERLTDVIQKIVAGCNRVVNDASPIVDARLPDGARVNVVMDPVAINGPIVTIRRFPKKPITMEQLLSFGSITNEAAEFLEKLVRAHYNIFVSGGTGSYGQYPDCQEPMPPFHTNPIYIMMGSVPVVKNTPCRSCFFEGKMI